MDVGREIRKAIETGAVKLGVDQTKKAVREGSAKLVILSKNCPDEFLSNQTQTRTLRFDGTNTDLGSACGKPFSISVLAVLEPGESEILGA
ncbi:MAG: 50S ribosomal protein L30e [Thermoplasmata archaeon]|nr:50S ribosomal protein L30e [Candidatus Thermoplasmatota archaeon]